MSTLLIELLTEELPPKALARLGEAFAQSLFDGLSAQGLLEEGAQVEGFATPRRLAASITGVRRAAPDRELREKVLPVNIAFDAEGKPTAPLTKKLAALAKSIGVDTIAPESLERAPDGKAESLFHRYTARGAVLADGLQAALSQTIAGLPIPKVMIYQRPNGDNVQFVRPAHRLIALLDDEIIPAGVLGLQSGNVTLGHRFLSAGEIIIPHATAYASTLKSQGKVIAGYAERKEAIRAELLKAAGADTVVMPEALLDEVNALVEWPVVYPCHFEEQFLAVPQECLILTMQTNQKYFALTDAQGHLRNRFLIVSNLATETPQAIIEGNERVVRPRLADARFFFEHDKKKPLADRVPQLARVVYHNKIGTQLERVSRLQAIAGQLAEKLGADVAHASRAALLAKADLLTDMVGEFPELQGTMGTYYARHDGEAEDVALACSEHYQPRFAGDALPGTATGTVVALADKLETLVGIWGIGLAPTGEKDPFALRRHALGILRMLIEKPLALGIAEVLEAAAASFEGIAAVKPDLAAITDFLYDRLRGYLKDKGYSTNEVEAVVSQRPQRLDDIVARLEAVRAFAALPQAEALAAANKRITNILKKTDITIGSVQPQLLREDAERALHQAVATSEPHVHDAFARGDFTTALKTLAGLREAVDSFFDGVMVMADDTALRDNRLALLGELHGLMNRVADISKLAA
ncbi:MULTISPECIES: glycine--tRNA ligase subunit beta [Ralstonia solanacearum species complex]|uniref:Glycine--tRNA ligase beta subunit n=1 Tax=Ralstonia solanacearum TaxID=305 RepID=A0A0S4XAD1_RALSL|nr:glycine--tRNA ligase subunit beta [Ralstonia pseudosolanacearum]CUV23930.1 glycine tRNA synthetase, beta subunit [Ralstonia solanacearum]MCK4122499.1 glycine--tRNA ligase subunit beta [Ralstonia pseudosolanacearum]MDC6295074.1 glycine--tRNA ligase subunit beta [Ralstonia pseudosolanacearum]MDD7792449.1 glycine--tRNA ligase subunit beta [Ralstonia pseudosolanacearum]MDN3366869.1 glycine--tRNA ligase subunit beta [Ralstonia pseudosolanacearum]